MLATRIAEREDWLGQIGSFLVAKPKRERQWVMLLYTDTLQKTPENKQSSFLDQIFYRFPFKVTSSILNIKKYVLISLHIDHVLVSQHIGGASQHQSRHKGSCRKK